MAFDGHSSLRRSSSPVTLLTSASGLNPARILDRDLEESNSNSRPQTSTVTFSSPIHNPHPLLPPFPPPPESVTPFRVGSPLTLATSAVPTALPTASTMSSTSAVSPAVGFVPPMNQISMPYIKRHAVKRVKSAKEACNTELQKVIHSITNYFEERLGEREREEAEEQYAKAQMQQQYLRELQMQQMEQNRNSQTEDDLLSVSHSLESKGPSPAQSVPPADLQAAIQQLHYITRKEGYGDGMTDSDDRPLTRSNSRRTVDSPSRSHSRQPSISAGSGLRKTNSLRSNVAHSSPIAVPASQAGENSPSSKGSANVSQSSTNAQLMSVPSPPAPSTHGQQQQSSNASKRLSRHIYVPTPTHPQPPQSDISSRSTSRSRSPMPFSQAPTEQATPSSSSPRGTNRRLSRHMDVVEPPVDPYISTLHDLIAVCTDIVDMSANTLTSRPGMGSDLVRKVQEVGRAWDSHPDWYGRTWYITVLLAVATLARVVEWFEAERQFWNFEEDDDDGEIEPLTFVLKPEFESPAWDRSGDMSVPRTPIAHAGSVATEDDNPLGLSREASISGGMKNGPRMSRDERVPQKDLRGGVLIGDRGTEALLQHLAIQDKPLPQTPEQQGQVQTPTQPPEPEVIALQMESNRIQASEHLKQKAEEAKSSNILMELNLDGEHFLYINRTWYDVIGSDPDTLVNTGMGISPLLHPEDRNKFKEASDRLQTDDSHTVEIQFRIRIEDEERTPEEDEADPIYRAMEGSGMLMLDRIEQVPSHTMWVIKPTPQRTPEVEGAEVELPLTSAGLTGRTPGTPFRFPLHRMSAENLNQAPFPVFKILSAAPTLCRICENQIPSWFFEKHAETCADMHKFEADIADCNESISELRNTVRELVSSIEIFATNTDKQTPDRPPLEYRGMSIIPPTSTATVNTPIQVFRPPLASRMQRVGIRKAQQKILEQVDEVLTTAMEISVPALREEESKEPIERQRLLSPTSENRISICINWVKPAPEDPALKRLVQDVDNLIKQKLDTVTRMQNTVRYSEKIRQEWEVRYEEVMTAIAEEPAQIETLPEELPEEAIDEDESDGASSTTSEYDFGRERERPSADPTPMASGSPAPSPAPPLPSVPAMPVPVPATYQGVGVISHKHSRSSTPSSVTSPLAIAAPIVASSGTPEIDRAALLAAVEDSTQTIRVRRTSMQNLGAPLNLEPKLLVTPPVSPSLGGSLAPISTTTAHRRRHSIVQPILSPTVAVSSGSHHGRLPSVAPTSKSAPSSIKDFDIIKPISKGAFGSVFLAKKKATGEYFAIKVLKKADMIAKNQITNVKAERMILMKQAESPFVVKLYFTFQSKDNLYLVMEYLNGGDCAALIKTLGSLPEEWTRAYIAEVVLGLEYLHEKGIVHRDLKPDNLLIDQHGHLKLTDFGLSRIGLLGRQTRDTRRLPERLLGGKLGRGKRSPGSRPTSFDSGYLQSPLLSAKIDDTGSYFNPRMAASVNQFPDDVSESSGSEGVAHLMWRKGKQQSQADSPLQSFATDLTTELRAQQGSSTYGGHGSTPPGGQDQKFVGTPDYLAPETILGSSEDDRTVDWWALGVVTYEFLYGIPPFHAETPDKVFENILSMKINWHEDWIEFSHEARNFMERLLIFDPTKRLGINGAKEVKAHPFFAEIEWDKVMQTEPAFVPNVEDPESTDYFDPRGAIPQLFQDDDTVAVGVPASGSDSATVKQPSDTSTALESPSKTHPNSATSRGPLRDAVATPAVNEFGTFNYKNLPVLKQANDEVIKKLKSEHMAAVTNALGDAAALHHRRKSMSRRINKPANVLTNFEMKGSTNPPSPSTSVSSIASSPSRGSMGPSTPGSVQAHLRRPSEYSAVERFKLNQMEHDSRRNSMPSRLRTASVSSSDQDPAFSANESWSQSMGSSGTSSSPAPEPKRATELSGGDRAVVCLIAEDNPISAKILETLLVRLGCRCILAADGAEAISTAHGDIKFDLILMDYHMPVVDGESAARYIKSTNNLNKSTPIVAVSAYVGQDSNVASNLFAACISKPVHKTDLLTVLRQLGFRTSTTEGPKPSTQVAKLAVAVS